MRVNSLDVNEETGRYLHLELLFAALTQYTEGIYIKGDAPAQKKKSTEKEYWTRDRKNSAAAEENEKEGAEEKA